MKNYLLVSTFILSLFSLELEASKSHAKNKVIYGVDNRLELYEILDSHLKNYSDAVLSIVLERNFKFDEEGNLSLFARSLGEELNLCSNEKFVDQPFVADCTAFLISPNLAVTAGHCVYSEMDCEHKVFLQGFSKSYASEDLLQKTFSPKTYSTCTEVLIREKDRTSGVDYAVIRFDKDFSAKKYFQLPSSSTLNSLSDLSNKNLMIMGHPSKLPLKLTTNFSIRHNDHPNYFVLNSDTFQGNSGSPVFDKESGIVYGIVVRGERDYIQSENETCLRSKVCNEDECRGEDAVRTSLIDQSLLKPYLTIKTIGLSHNNDSTKDGFEN